MESLRMPVWRALVAILSLITFSTSLTFTPTNATFPGQMLNLTLDLGRGSYQQSGVYPLTSTANFTQSSAAISGTSFFANPNNQYSATTSEVVFISCDSSDYPGLIQSQDVYSNVLNKENPTAIVLYSRVGRWCQPSDNLTTGTVYSMLSFAFSQALVDYTTSTQSSVLVIIGKSPSGVSSTDSNSSSSNSAPTGTTLTMIILYSITGVITALFMFIVIAGAIKARRHLDRYGRQVVEGRVRQTRAGGLARAMLDTIPIVKFGQRAPSKPTDIELGEPVVRHDAETTKQPETTERAVEPTTPVAEGGIAAASSGILDSDQSQGCSICTEDFEVGQDQRVLPCDHRYHPACVDPWLLNVSATCPLCRIDLRPPEEEGAEEAELPPVSIPLTAAIRRRSLLMIITGVRRPEGMTREERIEALRRYRRQNDGQAVAGAEAMDEVQTQHQLRRLFNVRTWRTTSRFRRPQQE